jgi:ceramide glucosyltransferase
MHHSTDMTFTVLALVMSVLVLLEIVLNFRQQSRGIAEQRRPSPRLPQYPSLSVIRPIKGADVGAAENFAAALDNGYPGEVETLFVFDEASDPGYPIAVAAVRDHYERGGHGDAVVIIAGPPPRGVTGKLQAMIVGERHARHELVAFGDSDTRPDRAVLAVTVATLLTTANAGCAFAPVVCNQPAERAGDVGYATMINMWYGPAVATVSRKSGDVPFIMGQLMVFTRECLRLIGGVGCARGELVDDMAIGKHVAAAGLRNVMSPAPLHIATGGMTVGEFMKLLKRWMAFGRGGLPFEFTRPMWMRGIEFWISIVVLLMALYTQHYLTALGPALALFAFEGSLLALNRRFGGAPVAARHLWMPFMVPILAPIESVAALMRKRVEWRGRAYDLDVNARLVSHG